VIPPTVDGWHGPSRSRWAGGPARVVSPELALVDGELRAEAIAALPPVTPYAFLERRPAPASPVEAPRPPAPSVALAGLAYLAQAVVRTCVFNALVFVGVALVVLLVNLAA
jgi:hypothetical protein